LSHELLVRLAPLLRGQEQGQAKPSPTQPYSPNGPSSVWTDADVGSAFRSQAAIQGRD